VLRAAPVAPPARFILAGHLIVNRTRFNGDAATIER